MKIILIFILGLTSIFTYLYITKNTLLIDDEINYRESADEVNNSKLTSTKSADDNLPVNNSIKIITNPDNKEKNKVVFVNNVDRDSKKTLSPKKTSTEKSNVKPQKNRRLKDNLTGIEAAFITDNNQADFSVIQGIMHEDIFNDFIQKLSDESFNNPDIQDVSEQYANSFLNATENLENGTLELNDFQCGQISCVGSLTAHGEGAWEEFLASRFPSGYDGDYPAYSFGNFPITNEDGSTEYRIFFSTTDEVNGVFVPTGEVPSPDGGG